MSWGPSEDAASDSLLMMKGTRKGSIRNCGCREECVGRVGSWWWKSFCWANPSCAVMWSADCEAVCRRGCGFCRRCRLDRPDEIYQRLRPAVPARTIDVKWPMQFAAHRPIIIAHGVLYSTLFSISSLGACGGCVTIYESHVHLVDQGSCGAMSRVSTSLGQSRLLPMVDASVVPSNAK